MEFKANESSKFVEIKIEDDEGWEPDEDFFVQLSDLDGVNMEGLDCRTRVTIIDDDKPGRICFAEQNIIKAIASEKFVEVQILRKNGSDGVISVDFETVELDDSPHTASPDVDYVPAKGTLTFKSGENSNYIKVEILEKNLEGDEVRDEVFGIRLSNMQPAGAKLSKRSFMLVNIVTDVESKKKQEALN